MSFWKWLGEVSYSLEKAEAETNKKREARRKEKLEALKYTFANLVTLKAFHKRMDDLGNGISQIFETTGTLFVQRFNDISARHTSELGAVISLKMDDVADKIKDFVSRGENLLQMKVEGTVKALFDTFDKANEHRSYATNAQIAVVGQRVQANDVNATNRYVDVLQRFQDLKQHITDQVASITSGVEVGAKGSPSPDWLAEHSDGIIEYGDALKKLRDGTIPAAAAMVQVVRAMRNLVSVDMLSAKRAMDTQAELWGVGQTELAEAA